MRAMGPGNRVSLDGKLKKGRFSRDEATNSNNPKKRKKADVLSDFEKALVNAMPQTSTDEYTVELQMKSYMELQNMTAETFFETARLKDETAVTIDALGFDTLIATYCTKGGEFKKEQLTLLFAGELSAFEIAKIHVNMNNIRMAAKTHFDEIAATAAEEEDSESDNNEEIESGEEENGDDDILMSPTNNTATASATSSALTVSVPGSSASSIGGGRVVAAAADNNGHHPGDGGLDNNDEEYRDDDEGVCKD